MAYYLYTASYIAFLKKKKKWGYVREEAGLVVEVVVRGGCGGGQRALFSFHQISGNIL